jgi:hypothetical protein
VAILGSKRFGPNMQHMRALRGQMAPLKRVAHPVQTAPEMSIVLSTQVVVLYLGEIQAAALFPELWFFVSS